MKNFSKLLYFLVGVGVACVGCGVAYAIKKVHEVDNAKLDEYSENDVADMMNGRLSVFDVGVSSNDGVLNWNMFEDRDFDPNESDAFFDSGAVDELNGMFDNPDDYEFDDPEDWDEFGDPEDEEYEDEFGLPEDEEYEDKFDDSCSESDSDGGKDASGVFDADENAWGVIEEDAFGDEDDEDVNFVYFKGKSRSQVIEMLVESDKARYDRVTLESMTNWDLNQVYKEWYQSRGNKQ